MSRVNTSRRVVLLARQSDVGSQLRSTTTLINAFFRLRPHTIEINVSSYRVVRNFDQIPWLLLWIIAAGKCIFAYIIGVYKNTVSFKIQNLVDERLRMGSPVIMYLLLTSPFFKTSVDQVKIHLPGSTIISSTYYTRFINVFGQL